MGKSHQNFTLLPVSVLMVCLSTTYGYDLFWKVEKTILQYGEDLSLSCQVASCCPETAGWGKWTFKNELTTIFIDVKNLDADDKSKYAGGTNMNGFSLVIRNLSKEDLNIAYSCTYGFLISQKKILLETDAFNFFTQTTSTNTTTTIETTTNSNMGHDRNRKDSKSVHIDLFIALVLSIVGGAIGGTVAVIWCVCRYFKKKSNSEMENKKGMHELTDISLSMETSENPLLKEKMNPMDIDRSTPVPALTCTESFPRFDLKHLRDSAGNNSAVSDESYMTCRTPSTFSFLGKKIDEE